MVIDSTRETACRLVYLSLQHDAHMRHRVHCHRCSRAIAKTLIDLLVVLQNFGDWHVGAADVLFHGQEAVLGIGLIGVALRGKSVEGSTCMQRVNDPQVGKGCKME